MSGNRDWLWALFLSCVPIVSGCSGDDTSATKKAVAPLDPAAEHFGKGYGDWGAAWWTWLFGIPGCSNALNDPTGASCAAGQNPEAPVFFLAGNQGGITLREGCAVPADKPLFFPIVNSEIDDVGVQPTSDEEKIAAFGEVKGMIDPKKLFAEIDGTKLSNLEQYWAGPTPFAYEMPAEPNWFSCQGIPSIQGTISGAYTGGYWLLLPALGPGKHELRFGGSVEAAQFDTDVTYRWTAQ